MGLRSIGIWLITISVCTLGSAAMVPAQFWNADSHNCMLPGNTAAYVLAIMFGFGGFLASLILSPVAVKSDQIIRDHWVKVKEQEKQGQSNALSLLRAACPPSQARAELLRPARSGNTTAPEHLLRAVENRNDRVIRGKRAMLNTATCVLKATKNCECREHR